MRTTSDIMAPEILDSWFGTAYEPNPTDEACLQQVAELDSERQTSR